MNATIQEIEGIDDYWGPAFRSVYEGEGHEAFVQQLDERIVQHDKEIEKLCNFHYQKKRKRGRRRPNKLRDVCEDQEEMLESSMSQYEDNNNHIPKRRRIDPKRLGGYINTFPKPGTQFEASDPHNSSKVSDHNSSDLEETLDIGISSDEYEEITKYHTLQQEQQSINQQQKQENHQLISKEPDSSTDDLRLYLRNRNRLTTSVDRQNLLISVEDVGNKSEQLSDYSSNYSADRQRSTRDQITVDKEVAVNSANDLRSYLRSKLSDELLGQDTPSHAEHYRRQSQHEAIQYDKRNNHQVELDREQMRVLSSEYNKGPRQYDDIRYEKGQSQCASVEPNKDQIQSLSTKCLRMQNQHEPIEYDNESRILSSEHTRRESLPEKRQSRRPSAVHDKGQGSLSSKRNRTLSQHENFEYDKGQRRYVASKQDSNKKQKADRPRDKKRLLSVEDVRAENLSEYNKRYVRPNRPSSSEHYTSRHLHENIESRQSPYSFKEHIRPPHGISECGGINGQRVFAHQLRGQSHHSAEYDSGDSYSRGESTEPPKIRSRRSSTENNIREYRPSSSENYKKSLRPIIEYHKNQNQARGSRRFSINYDEKSLSSHESADFDRGQGRQVLTERRRIGKSRPLPSERHQNEIQGVAMECQRERSQLLSDKKSQRRPSSAENYVQSGQSTEYIRGRNRSDFSEGHRGRSRPASADNNSRQNRLLYSEFENQINHKVSESQKCRKGHKINECFSGERGSLMTDNLNQSEIPTADITAIHNRSHVSADKSYPKRYQADDRALMSHIGRQVSSETCIKHHPLLPEIQRDDLNRPLPTQTTPTSVKMCKSTVAGQHNSEPGKIPKPYYLECPAMSSSVHYTNSNRVSSSQFFQNEILELELSHVERNDIENRKSFDHPLKKPDTTEQKSCNDGLIDASKTVLISDSDTDISMDILSSPRSNTLLSTINPEEQNASDDFSNKDMRFKFTNQLEASALLPSRCLSEPRDQSRETFAETSSIQDFSGNNRDSVESVIVDHELITDDARRCITPEPDVKSEPNNSSYDAISFNASYESLKVTGSPERLNQYNVKSEPICHYREISSAVDGKYITQNRLHQETPDYSPKFPSHSCDTVTPKCFIKSEIKQEPLINETLNTEKSTLGTDLGVNSSCGPNEEDKQGQATAESSPASSNDGSFKVSVRDVNVINLFLSGAKIDPLDAVLNKTEECEDDHRKIDVFLVTTDSWYTPRKITLENYPDKQKKLSISALVNSGDPRLRPIIKNTTIEILNDQKTEVLVKSDVAKSEKNRISDNTATKSNFLTSIDGQNRIRKAEEENEPIAPNLASKCGKLVLDIPNSSKAQISPESPQIHDEQLFTSLEPMNIESQDANAIPRYDPSNKNHNINDWIDSVNKVAAVCNWSDQQVVGYAIRKIISFGSNLNLSWSEWQENLRTAFPPKVNYGKMLLNMLNTTAKVGDSLVEYYYEKKILLDNCKITGEKAIECLIFGIEDESVRTILESQNFDNQEQFLTFLSNFKN